MQRLAWLLAGAVWLSLATVAADESPLVGKWEGTWRNNYGSDRFYVTVTAVEGSKARGTVYTVVSGSTDPAHNTERPFEGTFTNGHLRFEGIGHRVINLTLVSETRMEGSSTGGQLISTLALTKKKEGEGVSSQSWWRLPPSPLESRFYSMGVALMARRQFEAAEPHLAHALELEPEDPVNHRVLARLCQYVGRDEEARALLDKAL